MPPARYAALLIGIIALAGLSLMAGGLIASAPRAPGALGAGGGATALALLLLALVLRIRRP